MDIEESEFPQSVLSAAQLLAETLEASSVSYALIGGLAAGYHGRPRYTEDVDVLLQVPQLMLPRVLEKLAAKGFQFDLETVIRQWNQDHLTALDFHGVRIDWLKPVLPCFQHIIDTAEQATLHDVPARVATVEGLILLKLFSFRPQDQLDIQNLLAANRGTIDLPEVRREWIAVAQPEEDQVRQFDEWVETNYSSPS